MKRKICLVLALLVCMSIFPVHALNSVKDAKLKYQNIKIILNTREMTPLDANGKVVEPFTIDGTTYLPVRALCDMLGIDVWWNQADNTVNLYTSSDDISFCKALYRESDLVTSIGDAISGLDGWVELDEFDDKNYEYYSNTFITNTVKMQEGILSDYAKYIPDAQANILRNIDADVSGYLQLYVDALTAAINYFNSNDDVSLLLKYYEKGSAASDAYFALRQKIYFEIDKI